MDRQSCAELIKYVLFNDALQKSQCGMYHTSMDRYVVRARCASIIMRGEVDQIDKARKSAEINRKEFNRQDAHEFGTFQTLEELDQYVDKYTAEDYIDALLEKTNGQKKSA